MIVSLGLILFSGFLIGFIFEKIKVPKVVGMILVGILFGPSVLNILDSKLIELSPYLRQIALVVILTRSGLSLNFKNLKKIGRPAILMCFIPATFEIVAVAIFGPILLNISIIEALLLGTVLAAISPAIVVPRMIKLKNEGYGEDKNIPELIMAGSSADDVYVIVLFYAFLKMTQGGSLDAWTIAQIPISIVLGITIGVAVGFLLGHIFKKINISTVIKILIVMSLSFLMIGIEELLKQFISVSSLLGVVAMGIVIFLKVKDQASEIEKGYSKIWTFFEIILFVLVGISVDLKYALSAGFMPIVLLLIALVFRMIGVFVSLLLTNYNMKEKFFIMFAYIPKATVQASIGAVALSFGLDCGPIILTMAVLSILITAPLGAILIDTTYKKLIKKPVESNVEVETLEEGT